MQTRVTIKGMHCPSCKALIEDVCSEIPGIISCSVNYESGETIIDHNEMVDWENFIKEIKNLGDYSVEKI